jgi:septum formation protein
MSLPQIYLASASPRRRALLEQIGVRYEVLAVETDEAPLPGEVPEEYVARLALAKAESGWRQVAGAGAPVLGADTAVVLRGEILGKPANQAHGLAMLRRLSGQTHRVLTAVAVVRGELRRVLVSASEVSFRRLSDLECVAYWSSGEPQDKAGGYAVQGRAGLFVTRLTGSYSGVMGLPLYETGQLLEEFGVLPDWLAQAPARG